MVRKEEMGDKFKVKWEMEDKWLVNRRQKINWQ